MIRFSEIKDSFLQLVFPHICSGCGSDLLSINSSLCLRCIHSLPETGFHIHANNPVEKIFWGRLPVVSATAHYYFTKESLIQRLLHQFKYKGNKEAGFQLGQLMGTALSQTNRFKNIDALIPLPLFPAKERSRGYNQAAVLCDGINAITGTPVLKNIITRTQHTETQTKKGRIERWQNTEGKFLLTAAAAISNKHILLVDDVITTGATLEACGQELLKAENSFLSIATLCYASH